MNKRHLRTVLGWLVIVFTGYFFARALEKNWSNLQEINFSVNAYTAISIILFTLAVVYSGLLWGRIVEDLTQKSLPRKEAIRVHISSWLLKYVPGQAGSYINKVAWGAKQGYSKKVITITFIYENAFLTLASVALSLPVLGLFYSDVSSNTSLFVPLLLVVALLPFLSKKVFFKLFNTVFKKLRNQTIDEKYFLGTKKLIEYFLRFMIPRVITAAAFIFVAASFLHITPDMYIGLGAIYVLAGIVGLLAIFVPSGLGVREAVIVLLARNYFPTETAIALSLLARLYGTVGDGVLGLLYIGLAQKKDRRL